MHPKSRFKNVLTLAEVERRWILRVYALTGENVSATAKLLGIGRATVYRKLAQYKCQS